MKAKLSYQIFDKRKFSRILCDFFWDFRIKYDLNHFLKSDDTIAEETVEQIEYNRLDGDYSFVIICKDNNVVAILGRKEECEIEDDEEFDTFVRFTENPKLTVKSILRDAKRHRDSYRFYVILLENCKAKPVRTGSGRQSDYLDYVYECKTKRRYQLVSEIKYHKVIDSLRTELHRGITLLEFESILIDIAKRFNDYYANRGLAYHLNFDKLETLQPGIEYYNTKFYADLRIQYHYTDDNGCQFVERYCSCFLETKRTKFTEADVLNPEVLGLLLSDFIVKLGRTFSRMFKSQNDRCMFSNFSSSESTLYTNYIKTELCKTTLKNIVKDEKIDIH